MMRILLFPDPVDGAPAASGPSTEPTPTPAPSTPPSGTPAAATVNAGAITEDTIKLKQKLDETEKLLKQREQEHASVTDEFTRYKDATEARRTPAQKPARQEKQPERKFRIGKFV